MRLMRLLLTTFACAGLAHAEQPAAPGAPVVTTDRGKVSGVRQEGVSAFLGIPYASPPIGRDRWRAPHPAAAWRGIRVADRFSPSCPQVIVRELGPWTHEYMPAGQVSEDCLTVNVWTEVTKPRTLLPVLLWIHGGGFTSGSASVDVYDGAPLARQGVVVVSINYRVGLLGFLGSSEFHNAGGGNFGLQDQIEALRWIRRNIRAFGGDPDQVTIAGQSAGGMSVHALMLAPSARGLFKRAIPQSAVGLGLDVSLGLTGRATAERGAEAFLKAANVSSIDQARELSIEEIASAYKRTGGKPGTVEGPRPGPYADGELLPADPRSALASGRYNDVPVLIGLTADEGSGLNLNYRVADTKRYQELLSTRYGALAGDFERYYPPSMPASSYPALIRDGGHASLVNWAEMRDRTSRQPLYAYMWTHVEPGPKSAMYGAFHTSEVPYAFGTLAKAPERGFAQEDQRVSGIVSRYWINFVKTGDPNGAGLPAWPRFRNDGDLLRLGGDFGRYPALDPGVAKLFTRHLENGGSLLVF